MKISLNTLRHCLLLVGFLCTLHTASAFYNPERGRWLSRDSIGDMSSKTEYGFADNATIQQIDPDGRDILPIIIMPPSLPRVPTNGPTTFFWQLSSCSEGLESRFIQVGYDGYPLYSKPFVDDGKKGPTSMTPDCPPFYPGATTFFSDEPGGTKLGSQSPFLHRIKMVVCRVCVEKCCPGTKANESRTQKGYGLMVASIGPCVQYDAPTMNPSEDLGKFPQTNPPPKIWSDTIRQYFPDALARRCIRCRQ